MHHFEWGDLIFQKVVCYLIGDLFIEENKFVGNRSCDSVDCRSPYLILRYGRLSYSGSHMFGGICCL